VSVRNAILNNGFGLFGACVKRVLLVCAADCSELEERLIRGGCFTTRVDNGAEAILRAKHESLDTVLLISTGKEMDAAETALNLTDINSSLDIIILVQHKPAEPQTTQADVIQHAIPRTRILTIHELGRYLSSPTSRANAGRTKT
jgi:hypothetical protein